MEVITEINNIKRTKQEIKDIIIKNNKNIIIDMSIVDFDIFIDSIQKRFLINTDNNNTEVLEPYKYFISFGSIINKNNNILQNSFLSLKNTIFKEYYNTICNLLNLSSKFIELIMSKLSSLLNNFALTKLKGLLENIKNVKKAIYYIQYYQDNLIIEESYLYFNEFYSVFKDIIEDYNKTNNIFLLAYKWAYELVNNYKIIELLHCIVNRIENITSNINFFTSNYKNKFNSIKSYLSEIKSASTITKIEKLYKLIRTKNENKNIMYTAANKFTFLNKIINFNKEEFELFYSNFLICKVLLLEIIDENKNDHNINDVGLTNVFFYFLLIMMLDLEEYLRYVSEINSFNINNIGTFNSISNNEKEVATINSIKKKINKYLPNIKTYLLEEQKEYSNVTIELFTNLISIDEIKDINVFMNNIKNKKNILLKFLNTIYKLKSYKEIKKVLNAEFFDIEPVLERFINNSFGNIDVKTVKIDFESENLNSSIYINFAKLFFNNSDLLTSTISNIQLLNSISKKYTKIKNLEMVI